MARSTRLVASILTVIAISTIRAQTPEQPSKNCGSIIGKTASDAKHLVDFCDKGVVPGLVTGAVANDSLLYIGISRSGALAMRSNRLDAEQLMHVWMRAWRSVTGRTAVSVSVRYGDVEIAKGQTSFLGEDKITLTQ